MKAILSKDRENFSGLGMNGLAFISLLLLVLITYSNSFNASWHLDDGPNITENRNAHLQGFSWSEVKNALLASPSGSSVTCLRPVSRFSFALNSYFLGKDVFGYHVVNVGIHVLASFFLYLFLASALELPAVRTRYGTPHRFAALLVTVFWAIHPIQTQAVTYIVQRMASMAGMFYIMSMYFYLKAQLAHDRTAKRWFIAAAAGAGILSFGSKENAIVLPVSILLLRLLIVQGFTMENLRKTLRDLSVYYLLPLLVVTACLFAFHDIIDRVFALYHARAFTLWERLLTEQRVVLLYISLLLYPLSTRFSIDHPLEISRSLLDPPSTALSIVAILTILAAALLLARKQPLITFSLLFFFINHIVESTILPMELVFEHRNYIPSMFFFVPVVMGIMKFLIISSRPMRVFLLTSVGLVIVVLGYATFTRNLVWNNERSLWTDCLQKYPSSFRARHNLGRDYSLSGDAERAYEEYALALESPFISSSPKEAGITYFNMGLLAHERGDLEKAYTLYEKATGIDPCCPGAGNNMAGILLGRSLSNASAALDLLDRAIHCGHESETILAWSNKSILLWKLGRHQEALAAAHKAFEMNPGSPLNLLRLGYMLKEKGDYRTASIHFRRILTINPRDIHASLFLAEIYFNSADIEKGKSTLDRLLQEVPVEEVIRFLETHTDEGAGLEVAPRIALLLPFLEEILQEDIPSRRRNADQETHPSSAIRGKK